MEQKVSGPSGGRSVEAQHSWACSGPSGLGSYAEHSPAGVGVTPTPGTPCRPVGGPHRCLPHRLRGSGRSVATFKVGPSKGRHPRPAPSQDLVAGLGPVIWSVGPRGVQGAGTGPGWEGREGRRTES